MYAARGQVVPNVLHQRIGLAYHDGYGNHGPLAACAAMHHVQHHGGAAPVDNFFGRGMKMKLHQPEGGVCHVHEIDALDFDFNGVPVVFYAAV